MPPADLALDLGGLALPARGLGAARAAALAGPALAALARPWAGWPAACFFAPLPAYGAAAALPATGFRSTRSMASATSEIAAMPSIVRSTLWSL